MSDESTTPADAAAEQSPPPQDAGPQADSLPDAGNQAASLQAATKQADSQPPAVNQPKKTNAAKRKKRLKIIKTVIKTDQTAPVFLPGFFTHASKGCHKRIGAFGTAFCQMVYKLPLFVFCDF